MVESALNVAAEMVIEYSANGKSLSRDGNRGPDSAPQGVYRCAGGADDWLALAAHDDAQWPRSPPCSTCRTVCSTPTSTPRTAVAGITIASTSLLTEFCAGRDVDELAAALTARGVPAARVVDPSRILENPQPGRTADSRRRSTIRCSGRSRSRPSRGVRGAPGTGVHDGRPMLGQHNDEVLTALAGLDAAHLEDLRDSNVIGDRPLHL